MKTAEEWAKEYNTTYTALDKEADETVGDGVVPSEDIHEIIIRAIQLDAFKAGAKWAAEMCEQNKKEVTAKHWELRAITQEANTTSELLSKAILTAVEQLTEIPK